jgi:hypothetical protein
VSGEHPPGGWRVLDLVVIGCVGLLVGLLLAAVAARDRLPVPDDPAGIPVEE